VGNFITICFKMPPMLGIYKPFGLQMYAHFHPCQCGINGREKKRPKPQRSDAYQVGLSITKQALANSDKGLYFLPSISLRHVKFEYFLCSFAKQSQERLLVSPCLSTRLFLHTESFGYNSHLKYCLKI
jgi:hypothetical protein